MNTKLDTDILNEIKKKIIKRFFLNRTVINNLNENSESLYLEDLFKEKRKYMESNYGSISIDRKYVDLDINGKFVGYKPEYAEELISQLGHELLHAASRDLNFNGIINQYDHTNYALNEGITQMFADEVAGYTYGKFAGDYADMDIFARIIKYCVGERAIASAYFKHNVDFLEKSCNILASNKEFFETFNKMLTSQLAFMRNHPKPTKEDYEEYDKHNLYCYNYIFANLVIPKMRIIPFGRTKFMDVIYETISHSSISNEITDNLSRYLELSNEELNEIKNNYGMDHNKTL